MKKAQVGLSGITRWAPSFAFVFGTCEAVHRNSQRLSPCRSAKHATSLTRQGRRTDKDKLGQSKCAGLWHRALSIEQLGWTCVRQGLCKQQDSKQQTLVLNYVLASSDTNRLARPAVDSGARKPSEANTPIAFPLKLGRPEASSLT